MYGRLACKSELCKQPTSNEARGELFTLANVELLLERARTLHEADKRAAVRAREIELGRIMQDRLKMQMEGFYRYHREVLSGIESRDSARTGTI